MHKAYPMSIYCRCAIRGSAHATPSSALAKVGDGNIISQSKYRSFGVDPVRPGQSAPAYSDVFAALFLTRLRIVSRATPVNSWARRCETSPSATICAAKAIRSAF